MPSTDSHILEPQPVGFHTKGPLPPVIGGLCVALVFCLVRTWVYRRLERERKARTDALGVQDPSWVRVTKKARVNRKTGV